jgi:hypothetical protein
MLTGASTDAATEKNESAGQAAAVHLTRSKRTLSKAARSRSTFSARSINSAKFYRRIIARLRTGMAVPLTKVSRWRSLLLAHSMYAGKVCRGMLSTPI